MILIFRIKGIALILDSSFKLRFLSFVLKVLWTIIPTKFMEFKQKKKPFINIIMQSAVHEGRKTYKKSQWILKIHVESVHDEKTFPQYEIGNSDNHNKKWSIANFVMMILIKSLDLWTDPTNESIIFNNFAQTLWSRLWKFESRAELKFSCKICPVKLKTS